MRINRIGALLIVIAGVVPLTGCGEPAASSAVAVDVAALDAGNYSFSPTEVDGTGRAANREAIRIGAITPLGSDIDPRFPNTLTTYRSHQITPAQPPEYSWLKADEFDFVAPGLVAGWESKSTRRTDIESGREFVTQTMRFRSPDDARSAAAALSARRPGDGYPIPGYPDAISKKVDNTAYTPNQNVSGWLVRESMLLYIEVTDWVNVPYETADSAGIVARFFDKQGAALRDYTPTPLNELDKLPADVDDLLKHTLSVQGEKPDATRGLYPMTAALHFRRQPSAAQRTYTDAGVDYMAVRSTMVFRTKDEAAAERFVMSLYSGAASDPTYRPADPVRGIPTSRCYTAPSTASISQCYVAVGRYVTNVSGPNIQATHQRTAAQYKLLAGLK
ncbi:DUF7373 family lipoprotein [Nocardia camponoti]|uniref:Uncharacterized protein n=1 Tax=Nocardia camponoti TaxID=1616106 RepID=A0A917VAG3_9NOCA|nr:hypothetical protein [Nocardia camponoti]GGK57159.1 hypothetical protein GCM10011591_31620 [Nocardia camponoti]